MRVLVIDDNSNSLQSLCLVLKDMGHEPKGMEDPVAALAAAQKEFFPLIITDIRMPGMDGLELLSKLKTDSFTQKSDVVLITGHADTATAVEALRRGAYDYLNKPINARELAAVVERSAERQALLAENEDLKQNFDTRLSHAAEDIKKDLEKARSALRQVEGIGLVIAESPAMKALMREALIMHTEPSVPVLIEGETGTGKEVLARYIHYGDVVVDSPFLDINCAAIPHELFESELFGHEPGAFTGSRAEGAPGKLEQAGKGTLFLDEVAEMPLSLQPKLLRVLQERSFYRVGGVKKRSFQARIVCAGNRNMSEMVEKGLFRRDLYHRLRVGHLAIPPLRERREDIRPLAEHFLLRESARKKRHFTSLAASTLDIFYGYPWPGNIRELEHSIERAVLMHDAEQLLPEHVSFLFQSVATIFMPSEGLPGTGQDTLAAPGLPPLGSLADAPQNFAAQSLHSGEASAFSATVFSGAPSVEAERGAASGHMSFGGAPLAEGATTGPEWATGPATAPAPAPIAPNISELVDLRAFIGNSHVELALPEASLPIERLVDAIVLAAVARFGGNKTKAAEYLGLSRFALHRRLLALEKQ